MKILSIDFDIVMAPSIESYNAIVPLRSWEELSENPLFQLTNADLIHYSRLTKTLIELFKKNPSQNIIFVENHGSIPKHLESNADSIDLINIDHHHDLEYRGHVGTDKLDCSNWVGYLIDTGKIHSYTWVGNENSDGCDTDKYLGKFTKKIFRDYDIPIESYDKIFLCLSEPWVPPHIRPLYFLWKDLAENFYNTSFDIDFTIP